MRWFTHRGIGALAGVETAIVLNDALPHVGVPDGLPLPGAALLVAVAVWTSPQPDKVEPRMGWEHRKQGHYLSTNLLMALVPAAIFAGLSLAGAMFVVDRLGPESQKMAEALVGFGFVTAIILGCGRLVGIVGHTIADGFTLGGIPIWGPWDRTAGGEVRCRHLAPRFMRVRVKSWVDNLIGVVAIALAILLVVSQVYHPAPAAPAHHKTHHHHHHHHHGGQL